MKYKLFLHTYSKVITDLLAADAPSRNQVSVSVLYRHLTIFKVEEHQHFGPNIFGFHMVSGGGGGGSSP